jgi:hypothetical protein
MPQNVRTYGQSNHAAPTHSGCPQPVRLNVHLQHHLEVCAMQVPAISSQAIHPFTTQMKVAHYEQGDALKGMPITKETPAQPYTERIRPAADTPGKAATLNNSATVHLIPGRWTARH